MKRHDPERLSRLDLLEFERHAPCMTQWHLTGDDIDHFFGWIFAWVGLVTMGPIFTLCIVGTVAGLIAMLIGFKSTSNAAKAIPAFFVLFAASGLFPSGLLLFLSLTELEFIRVPSLELDALDVFGILAIVGAAVAVVVFLEKRKRDARLRVESAPPESKSAYPDLWSQIQLERQKPE
jgi:hypothetical protein